MPNREPAHSLTQVQSFFRLKNVNYVILNSKYFMTTQKSPIQPSGFWIFHANIENNVSCSFFCSDIVKPVTWNSTCLFLFFSHFSSGFFCAPEIPINGTETKRLTSAEIKEKESSILHVAAAALSCVKSLSRPFMTQIHPQLCQLLTAWIWGKDCECDSKKTLRGLFWTVQPSSSLYNTEMKHEMFTLLK